MRLLNSAITERRRTPIDQATHGRIRLEWQAMERRAKHIRAIADSKAFDRAADDFSYRKSLVGRMRALAKLRSLLEPAGARLELQHVGRHPLAIWHFPKPGERAGSNVLADLEAPDECQKTVLLNFIAVGHLLKERGYASIGALPTEVVWHALGRYLIRHPRGRLEDGLLEIHRAFSSLSLRRLLEPDQQPTPLILPVSGGAFLANMHFATAAPTDRELRDIQIMTFLDDDLIAPDQLAEAASWQATDWLDVVAWTFAMPHAVVRVFRRPEGPQVCMADGLRDFIDHMGVEKPSGR